MGKYLGFYIGPGKGNASWLGPIRKYLERCSMGEEQALVMQYSTRIYNTFAISTLSFVGQLERPPPQALAAEARGLERAI